MMRAANLKGPAIIIAAMIAGANAHAGTTEDLSAAYTLYKKGAYTQALTTLSKVQGDTDTNAMVAYWGGLCHARLQSFDRAAEKFRTADRLGSKAEDLDYELGQALYAIQDMRAAREAFKRSAAKKYKPAASQYYVGFTNSVLEEPDAALAAYELIQELPDDDNVRQSALYQIAEIKRSRAERISDAKEQKRVLREFVVPAYNKTIDCDNESDVGMQAARRLAELRPKVGSTIPRFINGISIPARSWFVKPSQEMKYDTNVVTEADEAVTTISRKQSWISKTAVFGKYEHIFDRTWVLSPEMDASYTYHLNRDVANVYQNDNVSLTGSLKNRAEYLLFAFQSATMLDFDFNQIWQNWQQKGTLPYYSRYYNLTLSQRMRLFGTGNTTLAFNYKVYQHHDETQHAIDPGATLSHNFKFTRSISLLQILGFNYKDAKSNAYDEMAVKLTSSFNALGFFGLVKSLDFSTSLDFKIIDTLESKNTRGYEKFIAPSVQLTYNLGSHFYASGSYAYTRNISKDTQNYAYSKHVVGGAAGWRF
ncbi:MAG: hypothetical protein A2583_08560 [Bdellovibrionales bacterium RIFOXYD1_FULL_53_11]|nr:MAG: hypothetical protein A2583_08560 [Bdellovibrionales bacterium RIFOXYD1_FULL_53_11]